MKIKVLSVVLCLAMVLAVGAFALAANNQNENAPVESQNEYAYGHAYEHQYERSLNDCDGDCKPASEQRREQQQELQRFNRNLQLEEGENGKRMQRKSHRSG